MRKLLLLALLCIAASGTAAQCAAAQTVPSCFENPPPLAADGSAALNQTPAECAELAKVLSSSDPKDVAWIPGAGLNSILGLTVGGFAVNSYALQFRVTARFNQLFTQKDELVRFGNDEGRARGGSWWTTLETVTDNWGTLVSANDVETRLALPPASDPHVVAYSSAVAVGTMGYFGIVAPAFGRSGGAVQFWFPSEPVYTQKTVPF